MRVHVTGRHGFIAQHLTERITKTTAWDLVPMPEADVVFSIASSVDVPKSIERPTATVLNNVSYALGIVEAARAAKNPPLIVHLTTAEVFGPNRTCGLWEPARPTNPYAASKAAQDAIFHAAAATYGLRVVQARTANVFGEHQPVNKFVPTVVNRILDGEPVKLFGDAYRRWIHADDVADGLIGLVGSGVEAANLTGSELVSNEALVGRIAARLNATPTVEVVPVERPGQETVYDVAPVNNPVRDDLDAGLDRAVAWFAR